jgi:hypothetical protein
VYIFGRLISDQEGKLSIKNVYLDRPDLSQKILLDLSKISQYCIFPSQHVALKGHHVVGHQLVFECEQLITHNQNSFFDAMENQEEIN